MGFGMRPRGAYEMAAETMRLHQIDIGPADRIGIASLAMVPILTSELAPAGADIDELQDNELQEPKMGKLEIINEMTPDDARLLPKSVREAVLSEMPIPPEVAVVQELRSALGVDDKADLSKLVRELREAKEEQDRAAVWKAASPNWRRPRQGHQGRAVRAIVVEMVQSRHPKMRPRRKRPTAKSPRADAVTELLQGLLSTRRWGRRSARDGAAAKWGYISISSTHTEGGLIMAVGDT